MIGVKNDKFSISEVQASIVFHEDFNSDSIWTDPNWYRSGTYYYVDETNGWLHKTTGGTTDTVDYTKTLSFPFTVECRGRLVSGGLDYKSPAFHFNVENGTQYKAVYNKNPSNAVWFFIRDWYNSTNGPSSENLWWSTRIVIDSNYQALYARESDSDNWSLVVETNYNLGSSIKSFGFHASWDAVIDVDYLTIYDTIENSPPVVTHPSDITYIVGTTGFSIVWTGTDDNPSTYSLYRNVVLLSSGSWSSGVGISFNIDGLYVGNHNFTIVLFDVDGLSISDIVWVKVAPIPIPPVVDHPDDITFVVGTTRHYIVWTGTDDYPDCYSLYRNGALVECASWYSGVSISYKIAGLSEGTYNFTIVLFDMEDLSVSDTVIVTILESDTSNTVNIGYHSLAIVVLVSLISLVLYRKKYLTKKNN